MIDLGTIKQGERGTLAITWEFPDALSSPASIVGATITAVAQNMDTGDVTAVSGTLTATAAAAATWALSDGDSGTAGTYLVTFRADVSGTPTYTLNGVLVIEENPAVTAVQNGALVGLSSAEAAWVTAGKTAVADGADLVDANDLDTAAYQPVTAFDAAGSAAAAQAAAIGASVAKSGDTMTGPLVIDATNTEALHVRKASDGGDIFRVDTTNGLVSIGAIAAPTELFEVRGDAPSYASDTFGIRSTLSIDPPSADTVYHWAAMLAQAVIPASNTVQAGAWNAAMYTYYKQDGAGTQADGRSISAIARINDGVITKLATIQTDNQLAGDAIATNIYHLYCKPTVKTEASQVTGNEYALYVGNMTAGVKNYAVYVDGADVECYLRKTMFAGDVTLDSGGRLKIDPGTAASPGLHFNNDIDLGLYRQGSNNLGIACGGQNAVEIKALQFGIGTVRGGVTPAAMLHVDNWAGTAQPVLYLDQSAVSEEIIEIVSTAGVGNAIELVGAKILTVTEFIKVTINGNTRYIPAGTIA